MNKSHNVRLSMIFFAFLLLYLLLLFNLYVIQIKQASFFKSLAKQQYQITMTSNPSRAEIYDRHNQPLAINKEVISAFIMPLKIENLKQVKKFLKKYFINAYKKLKNNLKQNFMYIKRRLTEEEIDLIKKSGIKDIRLLKETSRYYTNETLGPVVGFTNIDNDGLAGIELKYNSALKSKPSTYSLCKDARSGHFYFKRKTKIKGSSGESIYLTIDSTLQFLVYDELKDWINNTKSKEGAALILNPDNGDILVMANYPDFNPNENKNLNIEYTKNRIISDAYELGSVIKVFLAIAALEEDLVKPDEKIDCENKTTTTLNGTSFSTVKAHDILTFSQVIEFSNNIGIAKIGLRLGPKIYEHYNKIGFGKKIDILPGENLGLLNLPNHWSKASVISLSFGYEISVNLLQLAQAFSIIANNGYLIKPRIILNNNNNNKIKPLYKKNTIEKIKEILIKTATEGTAHRAKIKGYTVMGKTGTARLITNGKYDPKRHIYTFAGIIEKDDYKRIIVIFVKEPAEDTRSYASTIAAPLFEKVAHKMLIHDRIL